MQRAKIYLREKKISRGSTRINADQDKDQIQLAANRIAAQESVCF